jgi:hypothetical protein
VDGEQAAAAAAGVVVGLFRTGEAAEEAVNALVRAGLPRGAISTVARDEVFERAMPGGGTGGGRPTGQPPSPPAEGQRPRPEEAARREGVEALWTPRMGSLLAAGPLLERSSARRAAAAPGAPADALSAAMVEKGLAPEEAAACAERVGAGQVLVAVETGGSLAHEAEEAMRRAGAEKTVAARPAA